MRRAKNVRGWSHRWLLQRRLRANSMDPFMLRRYYFNSKTRERLWKPPEVEGWVIKTGSGKHRPYLGLKHYYYNTQSKKSSYEPPVLREK